MKSILDPSFVYIPSTHTNIKKTFDRIRREQRQLPAKVVVIDSVTKLGKEAAAWTKKKQ